MYRKSIFISVTILILTCLVLAPFVVQAKEVGDVMPRFADEPAELQIPRPSFHEKPKPQLSPDGLWYRITDLVRTERVDSINLVDTTGGPDEFGYTWDDSVTETWIDASDGTSAGLSADVDHTALITLPFSFKFYENTYASLYISLYGFVAFDSTGLDNSWQSEIPYAAPPNNVIAPNWMPFEAIGGYIKYKGGGTEPNRYFVVEWNNIKEDDEDNYFTFEVVLFENGDIVFNYLDMPYTGLCKSSGIEDSTGLDGLAITLFCDDILPDHSVHIYRPDPSARIKISPYNQGRFTSPGTEQVFELSLFNTGDLGADTFDLSVVSDWSCSLYMMDGVTPLPDTDSDGKPDTGILAMGESKTIIVKIQTPFSAGLGDENTAQVTLTSSIDSTKTKQTSFDLAVPAPFAQVYTDYSDGAMRILLSQPAQQIERKITPDYYFGYDTSVTDAPNGNIFYFWRKGRMISSDPYIYVYEIEYTILDRNGNTIKPITKLTDLSTATMPTYAYPIAVASAPDGCFGVTWIQRIRNSSYEYNYNTYFAIFDPSGNLSYGPDNLTKNDLFNVSEEGIRLYTPQISATHDNRFFLAWENYNYNSTTGSTDDIYYAIYQTDGAQIRDLTNLTNEVPGISDYNSYPSLSALENNQMFLSWSKDVEINSVILDHTGNEVNSTIITDMGGYWGLNLDSTVLSDQKIILAWTTDPSYTDTTHIAFTILDSNTLAQTIPTTILDNPKSITGNDYVSVSADPYGHAVLTWMEFWPSPGYPLYYALVGSDGSILTEPMIFLTDYTPDRYILTSTNGYGNTTYTLPIPTNMLFLPLVIRD